MAISKLTQWHAILRQEIVTTIQKMLRHLFKVINVQIRKRFNGSKFSLHPVLPIRPLRQQEHKRLKLNPKVLSHTHSIFAPLASGKLRSKNNTSGRTTGLIPLQCSNSLQFVSPYLQLGKLIKSCTFFIHVHMGSPSSDLGQGRRLITPKQKAEEFKLFIKNGL